MRACLRQLVWAATALSLFAGCGGKGNGTPSGSTNPAVPGLMEGWGKATALGGGGLLTYALTVDPTDLETLVRTAVMEQWVPAELTVSGMKVGKVGLRYKGSDGTLAVCFENGRQICDKASFKLKFDLFDPNQRFAALKRLNLHSMLGDTSMMRERLAVEIFRRMRIEAPRVAHAFMTVNGEPKGVFAVVENLDGRFTKAHWPDAGNGNLYKESWPNEVQPGEYTQYLETNEEMPDNTQIAMFAQALFAAKPPELPGVIDRFAHLDQIMRYVAVDRAINNVDGITTFYCSRTGQECSNHNYYWYQHEADNRFILVPWDLTVTFGVKTLLDKIPPWNAVQPDCGVRTLVEGAPLLHPSCDLFFQGIIGAGRPAYDKALDQLLSVWDVGQLQDLIDGWATEIAPGVAIDPYGPGVPAWRAGVETLKSHVAALRERLVAMRASQTVDAFGLTAPGFNDFEGVSALAFHLGVTGDASPRSGSNVNLNLNKALDGSQDVYFGFDMANDELAGTPDLKAPWVSIRLPVAGGTRDISKVKFIRLRVSADDIRNIRIEVDSPKYTNPEDGIRFGRNFLLSREASEIEIPVTELNYPSDVGNDPTERALVLTAISSLLISPMPKGINDQGLLPKGKSDRGFIRIDDISFDE